MSAVIDTLDGAPIIVERAMYLSTPGHPFNAGHESMGVTAPALNWFLAEGATGPYFDLFLLIANPNPQDAAVTVTYLLTDGRTFSRTLTAPANSRSNIWVDLEQIPGEPGFPLADAALSSTVASTNGVPIIVERAMWWPGDGWAEGHNSAGATTTGTAWALAEGEVGGARSTETYLLIANTSAFAGSATVTLYFEDGTSTAKHLRAAAALAHQRRGRRGLRRRGHRQALRGPRGVHRRHARADRRRARHVFQRRRRPLGRRHQRPGHQAALRPHARDMRPACDSANRRA